MSFLSFDISFLPTYFKNFEILPKLKVPVGIVWALEDEIIPEKNLHRLMKSRDDIQTFFIDSSHNTFSLSDLELSEDLKGFFA
jgi:pimeloyl-ACP methyl ester carboxylesterase